MRINHHLSDTDSTAFCRQEIKHSWVLGCLQPCSFLTAGVNQWHLLRIKHGAVHITLQILTIILPSGQLHPHFQDEKSEVQRGKPGFLS